jgi:hypothetical protein
VDPGTHKRYLDYRERHAYFGHQTAILTMSEFSALDREHRELSANPRRDDEEEARLEELASLLLRD